MRSIVAVCLLAFTLSACSGATPTPVQIPVTVEVTRSVPVTVEVTRIVTASVTVVVTATPIPTATPRPTPRPKPTATPITAAVIPAGWKSYTLIDGSLKFNLPAEWAILNEGTSAVVFGITGAPYFVTAGPPQSGTVADYVVQLKQFVVNNYGSQGAVTIPLTHKEGVPYVLASIDRPGTSNDTLMTMALISDSYHSAFVGYELPVGLSDEAVRVAAGLWFTIIESVTSIH